MAFREIDLSSFPPEREKGLKSIYRYSMFELMYYRSNLWQHSLRLLWLIEAIASTAQKHIVFDVEKTRIMALVHDDAEIITGDVQAGVRALMSKEELAKVDRKEEEGIEVLSAKYPKMVHGYEYKILLTEMLHKNTLESQLVSYVDKFDAYNESIHEILAGNIALLRSVMFYVKTFALFPQKFPALKDFFSDQSTPLTFVDNRLNSTLVIASRYASLLPYTKDSIRVESDFPFYNEWKRIIIDRGGEEGLRWLIEQHEYNVVK
jgi:5'-deoxynucleotidase YfbR-like HD superfamily hydrolase